MQLLVQLKGHRVTICTEGSVQNLLLDEDGAV